MHFPMEWHRKEPNFVEKMLIVTAVILVVLIGVSLVYVVMDEDDEPTTHGIKLEFGGPNIDVNETMRATNYGNLSRSEQWLFDHALSYRGAPLVERRVSGYVPDEDAFEDVGAVRRGVIVRNVTVLERGMPTRRV